MTPSREFRSMHMGRHGRPKIAHRTWLGAWLHKHRIAGKFRLSTDRASVYPCWFTDWNTLDGRKHWHVGHVRFPHWVKKDELKLTKARVKAAAEGGYRLSVVLTEPELARLEELAGDMRVQEFAVRAILGLARTGSVCCHLDPPSCMLDASRNSRREIPHD